MAYLWPCLAKNLPINWPNLPKPTIPMVRRRGEEGSGAARASEAVMMRKCGECTPVDGVYGKREKMRAGSGQLIRNLRRKLTL